MIKELTVGRLKKAIKDLDDNVIIIIGDDDEFNGCHNAWFAQTEELKDVHKTKYGTLNGHIMEDDISVHIGKPEDKVNRKKILLIS